MMPKDQPSTTKKKEFRHHVKMVGIQSGSSYQKLKRASFPGWRTMIEADTAKQRCLWDGGILPTIFPKWDEMSGFVKRLLVLVTNTSRFYHAKNAMSCLFNGGGCSMVRVARVTCGCKLNISADDWNHSNNIEISFLSQATWKTA